MHPFVEKIYAGATPPFNSFVDELSPVFSLLGRLKDTAQDSEWHGEGNVHIHTEMVVDEVYGQIEKCKNLGQERRLALILAAAFHDIAKPLVSRVQELDGRDRIISPRHAQKAMSYMAFKIPEIGLPFSIAKMTLDLVGQHDEPKFLVIKNVPACKWRQLARLADMELLYYLEIADLRGRQCLDRKKQIEYIELFRLGAEEYDLWERKNPYLDWRKYLERELARLDEDTRKLVTANAIRDAEAGNIYTPHEAIAKSSVYRDRWQSIRLTDNGRKS